MPLKNSTSVARNTQMPSAAVSACCRIVANCGSGCAAGSNASGIDRAVLRDAAAGLRVVMVGTGRDDRGAREIVGGRRRACLPFEPGRGPRVWQRAGTAQQRPGQNKQRDTNSENTES